MQTSERPPSGSQASALASLPPISGLDSGDIFTLFVVPSLYMLIAKDRGGRSRA